MRTSYFQWDDDEIRFVLDQHAELDFYSASLLKQQSADRHIYACLSTPKYYSDSEPTSPCTFSLMLSREANTNFVIFGSTQPGLEPTRGEHANNYIECQVTVVTGVL